jgi:transposase
LVGATAVMRPKDKATRLADWIREPLARKPFRLVSVALANTLARIAWAVPTRGAAYGPDLQRACDPSERTTWQWQSQ